MIDTYDACMAEIYKERFPNQAGPVPAIEFKGLKNIFSVDSDGFQSLKKVLGGSHDMARLSCVEDSCWASAEPTVLSFDRSLLSRSPILSPFIAVRHDSCLRILPMFRRSSH
jgi:hypothetical protein